MFGILSRRVSLFIIRLRVGGDSRPLARAHAKKRWCFLCLSDAASIASSAVEPPRLTKADTTPRAFLGCFIYFYSSISEVDSMLIALYHHFVDTRSPGGHCSFLMPPCHRHSLTATDVRPQRDLPRRRRVRPRVFAARVRCDAQCQRLARPTHTLVLMMTKRG